MGRDLSLSSLSLKLMKLAVPLQKSGMWAISLPRRGYQLSGLVDYSLNSVTIVYFPVYKNIVIVRKPYKPPIKHPMCSPRQSETVSDTVRSIMFNRPDMGCLRF